ncbi:hypothetical protein OS493_038166 [Desmophyllum pertusum]|uniref:Uncharacterized protein n=1 Tax=Desmophyllum pertusum TaxID=174260 RepID=A0A9W9Y723_9CNID|nr:hypothetical protein OS493_038166 [Desmophyllum pertusum]
MMEKKGLRLEGLDLVVKYLTNVPELAQYLYVNSKEVVEEAGLEIVRRRLGPDLEVLGGLGAAGIDVTKEWALPRLKVTCVGRCCQGADEGEMVEVPPSWLSFPSHTENSFLPFHKMKNL